MIYKSLVIHENELEFEVTTIENDNKLYMDGNKILHFKKSNGFKSTNDVMDYIDTYF